MTKLQAENIVEQYRIDMEYDTFEEALESMNDCLDLLTPEYVAAVMLLNKETV